ncbi:MAG: hypothetical protein BZY88_13715 [SAR202 cluster bacterium Io17-Chloro-G9]|nr:MAG: hypothetical protein BZY88_13715 [SAR202 cluster bacterium Io17-Chloro-G9]
MGWSNRPTGLTRYQSSSAYRGYTLLSAYGGYDAYLIDMDGNFVHHWHSDEGIIDSFLLDNGNLLFRNRGSLLGDRVDPATRPVAHVRELSWDGSPVWEHRNPGIRRHNRLTNGNTLLLVQYPISSELTREVRGGFVTSSDAERMQGDLVM